MNKDNEEKLKLSFNVVRPVKSFGKTIDGRTILLDKDTLYPVVGYNNGFHVICSDTDGEPYDFTLCSNCSKDGTGALGDGDVAFEYYDMNALFVTRSFVFPKEAFACDTSFSRNEEDDLSWCSADVFKSSAEFGLRALIERYNEAGIIDMTQVERAEKQMCEILSHSEYARGVKAYISMLRFLDKHNDAPRCHTIQEMVAEIGNNDE